MTNVASTGVSRSGHVFLAISHDAEKPPKNTERTFWGQRVQAARGARHGGRTRIRAILGKKRFSSLLCTDFARVKAADHTLKQQPGNYFSGQTPSALP